MTAHRHRHPLLPGPQTRMTTSPASMRRKEDPRLVTGQGTYVGDIAAEGMLTAAFLRSDVAHGTIASLDIGDAGTAVGVAAVFAAADLDLPDIPSEVSPVPVAGMSRPILARDRVRHTGEAVAMIIAERPEQAADAVDLAWVDIEPLPVVIDPRTAAEFRPPIHPAAGTNVVERFESGDRGSGWGHDVEVTVEVVNQRLVALSIEALSALAVPDGDGVLLYVGHQSPHQLKEELAGLLDFDVDVIVPDVGGGFGMKGRIYPEYVALLAAARRLDRPVRWLQSRREHLLTGTHGRDMVHTVTLGGNRTGRIVRAHFDILASVGAYPHVGAQVPTFSRLVAQGLYDIAEVTVSSTTVVTNAAPTAPYRGAGRPEAACAIERAVETFARRTGLDPLEVRRRNVFASADLPHQTSTGAVYDSGDYAAAIDVAAQHVDVPALRKEQIRRRREGRIPLGLGFGAFIERAGGPPDAGEFARLRTSASRVPPRCEHRTTCAGRATNPMTGLRPARQLTDQSEPRIPLHRSE